MALPPDDGLPPWGVRLISELDASDRRAHAVAETLTTEQLNWAPGRGRWSVGQCLEHLCITNDVYVPAIARSLADHREQAGVPEITPGWFGRWFIRAYIEPSAETRRGKAPKKIAPPSHVERSVVERFLGGNQSVRALVVRAATYDVNRVRFTNPFIPLIHFTVGTGLEIVVRHQRRHLLQAERIRECPDFPRAVHAMKYCYQQDGHGHGTYHAQSTIDQEAFGRKPRSRPG